MGGKVKSLSFDKETNEWERKNKLNLTQGFIIKMFMGYPPGRPLINSDIFSDLRGATFRALVYLTKFSVDS